MGWVRPETPQPEPPKAAVKAVIKAGHTPLVHEPPTDVAAGFKDEMAWNKFRSTKGWLAESVATRMYDFIKHKGLFGELLEFTRKWK